MPPARIAVSRRQPARFSTSCSDAPAVGGKLERPRRDRRPPLERRGQRLGIGADRQNLGYAPQKGAVVQNDVRALSRPASNAERGGVSHSTSQIWPGSIVGSGRRCPSARYSLGPYAAMA